MPDESTVSKRKFDSLTQEAYLSLWRTYDRLKGIEEQFFSTNGLTPQQYNVLRLLEAAGEAMPTLSIAGRLVSKAPDITRMIDRLEQEGWVERERSTEDRRTVLVSLTAKGAELLTRVSSPLQDMHNEQLGHLSSKDLRSLSELLSKARKPHEPADSVW